MTNIQTSAIQTKGLHLYKRKNHPGLHKSQTI